MPSADETVDEILTALSWDQRVALMRLIPERHGTAEHQAVFAAVARGAYVQHLAPDFAYIHEDDFYELPHMVAAYDAAAAGTVDFTDVAVGSIARVLVHEPISLLVFRNIVGLTRSEFAHSTSLASEPLGLSPVSDAKVNSMERRGVAPTADQARVLAETIDQIMAGTLFGEPPGELKNKQSKPDTADGWNTVRRLANGGAPYSWLLHQRHYGGAFRQILDATSTRRGDIIEDAVEALFIEHGVPYIRTGAHNQAQIEQRFGITVTPAPDFVVFDESDTLRALLECKGANDGGTARDKALRFERLRAESHRLGGVPLCGVLGGIGWSRVNDTLGPVVRDCEGRVFTLANLPEMMTVNPFPQLIDVVDAVE